MHADINVRFELRIDDDKTLPLADVAEFIADQDIESSILETVIKSLDEQLVEAYCGTKHARGNGDERFQRRGTKSRSAVTTAGEHDFDLHYIKDTAAGQEEDSYFRPVEDIIAFDGQKQYQQDISFQSADLATTLSYRDAAAHRDGILSMPSRTTINRRVKEYGSRLDEFIHDQLSGTNAETVIPDGTKCYSQDDDCDYHDVQITLAEDTDENSRSVLDVSVNTGWNEIASSLEAMEAITDDARVVSDSEPRLVTAFTDGIHDHQLDLAHVPRTLSYKLWDDGALSLDDRKEITSEVAGELFHLTTSVEKHRPEEDRSAIRDRIARTKERVKMLR